MISLSVRDEHELQGTARLLLSELEKKGAHILALGGDLGVGKTALAKAVAKTLSIAEDITSPTFVIMKSYSIPDHPRFTTLVHIDAYRIEERSEMNVLGFEELCRDPQNLIIVEWPERLAELLPPNTLSVAMSITEGTNRLITYGS